MILIIGTNLSIMQYGLINDLPQNNCLRCNSFIDLIYILAVKIAPKLINNAIKASITIERLVIRNPPSIKFNHKTNYFILKRVKSLIYQRLPFKCLSIQILSQSSSIPLGFISQ